MQDGMVMIVDINLSGWRIADHQWLIFWPIKCPEGSCSNKYPETLLMNTIVIILSSSYYRILRL